MTHRPLLRISLALSLIFASVTITHAGDPFVFKLKKDDVFFAKSVNIIKQTIGVMGRTQAQEQEQTTFHKYTVKSADENGMVLEQTVLRSEVKGNLPGTAEVAKKLKGVSLTFTLNTKHEVTKVEGYDKFLDALVGDNAEVKKQVAAVFSEDTLKQGVSDLFGIVPAKPVKVGDTWKKETKLGLGPMGTIQVNSDAKYATAGATGDKMTWKATTKYAPPKEGVEAPFVITKGELKTDKFEGDLVFDSKVGRIVSASTRAHIFGKLTMSVMGREFEMTLDQNLTNAATMSDKNLADE